MDPNHNNLLIFVAFFVLCLATNGVTGYATVTGSVFCDQCKDGERSLFDFPVSGIKISVTCADENGQVYMSREETTNWLGGYVMRFDGTPDLSNCYAQVSDNGVQQDPSSCSIASGPAQKLKLMFSFFGIETFAADALLAQPVQPSSFCPKPPTAPVMPPPQVPVMPPPQVPVKPHPKVPVISPDPPATLPPPKVPVISPDPPTTLPPPLVPVINLPPVTSPPQFKLPPLPQIPPMPFVEPSACSHQLWMKPEYRCYWRAIGPDTKVAVAFGLVAGRIYGTDMTVREALDGRGEAYKTLLREATTALLNSYNSLGFPYNSVAVITYTNLALLGNSFLPNSMNPIYVYCTVLC
jgi:hypothetical protein